MRRAAEEKANRNNGYAGNVEPGRPVKKPTAPSSKASSVKSVDPAAFEDTDEFFRERNAAYVSREELSGAGVY